MSTEPRVNSIIKWRTLDGKEFHSESAAYFHADEIDAANRANAVLEDGKSVADALRAAGWTVLDPILESVTKDTKLIIEHWQCRSEPGYTIRRFNPERTVYVFGYAGSWSGSYGNDNMPLRDLVDYAKNTAKALGQKVEGGGV
jgi:hypothetical protein